MCGICGGINIDASRPIDRERISLMTTEMKHRGPDQCSHFFFENVGLGMSRLSIIDPEGGHQPFVDEKTGNALVCNGEIYNYRELRSSLTHLGYSFRSQSDVEVILHAYQRYGLECVEMLEGMFAFALWDNQLRRLIIGRDRMGIKPLHYAFDGKQVFFASELGPLLKSSKDAPTLDLQSLYQYLSFDYVPTPRSICKDVNKLPPGCIAIIDRRGFELRRYWDVSFRLSESRPPMDSRDYAQTFVDLFTSTVNRELQSDVPIGLFLSGGIDSSAVIAAAAKRGASYPTFSVKFTDSSFDESDIARRVSSHFNCEHHELTVTESMCKTVVEKLPELLDEPLADSSFVPSYLLSQFASQRVKVVLGGDGGDEIFAGYPTHQAHQLINFYEGLVPYYLRAKMIPHLLSLMPRSLGHTTWDYKARRFLQGRGVPLSVRHHRWIGSFSDEEKSTILHPDLHFEYFDTYAPVREHLDQSDATSSGNQVLYLDMKMYLEGDILAKVDRASMRNSLEVRVPFLNRVVVDFINQLPYQFKLRYLRSKWFLRLAMGSQIPTEVVKRKKKGFNFPLAKYLQTSLRGVVSDTLMSHRQGLFNREGVERVLMEHHSRRADNSKQIWNLYVIQRWLDQYSR